MVWDYCRIKEIDHVDELVEESTQLRSASLISMAFNKPRLLGIENAKFNARVKAFRLLDVAPPDTQTVEELRAVGAALAERIAKSGAFKDVMEVAE